MQYGLIGEHLGHSYSVPIHRLITGEDYELREIAPEDLGAFMTRKEFRAINVTIPYKQDVIPYLDEISDTAREIGAVNTIVNRDGHLYGTNTDAAGLQALIIRVCPDIRGRKTLVLGTGGTSKTAVYTANAMGADPVIRVSRSARDGAVTYEEALRDHRDAEILINTTPCGMFPAAEDMPVNIDGFPELRGVVDVIYNPLRTKLVLAAMRRGIPAEGGLYMLAAQAVRAAEVFRGIRYDEGLTERIYRRMARDKENIVLTGMPGSGKSAVSSILGARTGREVIDTDRMIVEKAGMEITEIFRRYGEKHFRDLESEVIREAAARAGVIISTGGGAVLREENVDALRRNGRLVWLDRKPEDLVPTDDRPLADSREKMAALHAAREPIYRATADERIAVTGSAEDTADEAESRWNA
ncbi:MAG: shikimate dehydrogenase [Clostridia bacterium]|nr:shikimate dehydrogenase [Clostridia bacterium]